jgi:ParB-like chromosome segregation protein Spo0J
VAGHARLAAAIAIGCQAPVVTQDFDSETDEIAFLLADNRLAELAITDDDILQSNLDLLDASGFDIGDIGFDLDIDLSIGETSSDGGAAEERQQSSQETGLDEIKVFVIPEKRVELMDLLKVFALKNGEKSIRWQKR